MTGPSTHSPADLAHGTFSDNPPWLVDPDALAWLDDIDTIRMATSRRVPSLITPPRMPPLRRAITVLRHFGWALAAWFVTGRRRGGSASTADLSRRMREVAETLGPTYIKLGQIISSGEGIFPAEFVAEFTRCRDQVPAESFASVRRVVESDLGATLESTFAEFAREPIAAASIAQVHAATLHDGTKVVVKVQRPTVDELVHKDLQVMAWLSPYLVGRIPVASLANPPALVEVFAHTINEELDFRLEAANMLDVARVFADLEQTHFVVPRPHPELVTRRVLVMERLDGFRFDDVERYDELGVDTHAVVRAGMIGFMEGALIHGIFHGDLHGGNLYILEDGRTALLDFGITGRMTEAKRLAFVRLLIGGMMNNPVDQLGAMRDLGALPADADLEAVANDLGLLDDVIDPLTMTPDQLTEELQRIVRALLGYGARMPKELMLFVKNMVFLDGAIATLAPDLDLFAEITHVATYFVSAHGARLASDVGMDPEQYQFDPGGIRVAFGVDAQTERMTYRELQERREIIQRRLRDRI
ncbi:MAG: AarF/UbiB family protein [Acidimicrobiales bacterium]|nr:AarF/UbiB family protein [Acidimicrobiales bacterium]MDG1876387.1 AarF/UbiB family protein [Acidimicrobiales bacterium]